MINFFLIMYDKYLDYYQISTKNKNIFFDIIK